MAISKNQIKLVASLHQKKYRTETGLFLAEGTKIITELFSSDFEVIAAYCTKEWIKKNTSNSHDKLEIVALDEIKKMSALATPSQVIAIVRQKKTNEFRFNLKNKLTLFLEDIGDPGNLGTILRIADWFGIESVFCSLNSVDVYNPKTIQASMGSFLRVNCFYTDLQIAISQAKNEHIAVYASLLKGKNVYCEALPQQAVLVMGNEAFGISNEIKQLCTHTITIPSFSAPHSGAESLNISIATSILVSEFKRRERFI